MYLDARRAHATRARLSGFGFRQGRGLESRLDDFEPRVRWQRRGDRRHVDRRTHARRRFDRARLIARCRVLNHEPGAQLRRDYLRCDDVRLDDLRLDELRRLRGALGISGHMCFVAITIVRFALYGNVERRCGGFRSGGYRLADGLRTETPIRVTGQRIGRLPGKRRARPFAFASIAAFSAIAATVPVTAPATSLRRFARHRWALGWAGQSRLG